MLSVVIPVHNEEECIENTIRVFNEALLHDNINHELLVVNDHSSDKTVEILERLKKEIKELRFIDNDSSMGFGSAITKGLNNFKGDCVTFVMGDLSEDPQDLLKYYYEMQKGYDCVFGSRFIKGGEVSNYPKHKLFLNRIGNWLLMALFFIKYNDITNPFKLYTREAIEGIKPIFSKHYNIELEIPLKAIIRGYSYSIVSNKWIGRKFGYSKFKIKELGPKYFFMIGYCLLEKWLTASDYKKVQEYREIANKSNANGK